ncbi:hypothetical protein M569_17334 [Genlisea aurea]|uniref:Uncharacterized protein n=1 Tax=Genlisea aurea TaxID=192259 RepID=S8D4A8_9LAMI|nr:hypothetical protein M569_17334 [Genlisea aurea]
MSKSGVGIDTRTYMVFTEDGIWEEIIKIFGQDRACGEDAQSFDDAQKHLDGLFGNDDGKDGEKSQSEADYPHPTSPIAGGTPLSDYGYRIDTSESEPGRERTRKKRKERIEASEEKSIDRIEGIAKTTAEAFQQVISSINMKEDDVETPIVAALEALNMALTTEQLLHVCTELTKPFAFRVFLNKDTPGRVGMSMWIFRNLVFANGALYDEREQMDFVT